MKNKFNRFFFKDQNSAREKNIINTINHKYGNLLSFKLKKSVDSNNNPIPWFTYPALEYLKQLDIKEKKILEWGLGNSTLYFAQRCSEIISIEHNPEWFEKIKIKLPLNSFAYLLSENEYANFPLTLNRKFDIIIIDGIKRKECIENSLKLLEDGGFIIYDNSDRNPEDCEKLRNKKMLQVDFHGFGPINDYTWTTSFFFTNNVTINPINNKQPIIPIGGGY